MVDTDQRIYMFRHGATPWSMAGKHTGLTDVALTDAGRRDAERLRPYLRSLSIARVMTSPLQRARETCELAGLGAGAENNRDLVEWNYGDYEGLTTPEIYEKRPGWEIFTDGCPNGETPSDVAARVDRVAGEARATKGNVAIFAHGHVLRVLAARWLDMAPDLGRIFVLDTATVNILGYYYASPAILRWNAPTESDA